MNHDLEYRKKYFSGIKLRNARKFLGVSVYELSCKINSSHNYLNHIESGSAIPSNDLIKKISQYLNVDPSYFFEKEIDTY